MNGFYKKNGLVFVVALSVLLHGPLHAIKINDALLEDIIKPGEVVWATFPENSGVILKIEKDNFYINDADIDGVEGLEEVFQEIVEKSNCPLSSGGELSLSFGTMERSWARLRSGKSINLTANTWLSMGKCLLDSPNVSITGNKMEFFNCFLINTKTLSITLNSTEWDCIIRIEFHDQAENPTLIDGKIDLKNGEAKNSLVIANPREMSLQFIFDKKTPQSSQTGFDSKNTRSENTEAGNTHSQSHSKPSGFVDRSMQAIAGFYKKYMVAYL